MEYINKLFNKDNLELLKELPNECIDLIYCDILYGTGRDFGDYKDITSGKEEVYKFYKNRIEEMYRVLSRTGSIYNKLLKFGILYIVFICLIDTIYRYKMQIKAFFYRRIYNEKRINK